MSNTRTKTKTELVKTSNQSVASFDEWSPENYLTDYYSNVEQDEQKTLKFLVEEFKKIKGNPVALEFGIGPTLHHLLPLAPYVSEIHITDYLQSNIDEVEKWKHKKQNYHNWNEFTKLVLQYEGTTFPTKSDILQRENLARTKLTKLVRCDASKPKPLGTNNKHYDVVLSCYCAESATTSKDVWELYMKNISSLVAPGKYFVTTALRHCTYYKVGDKFFPCANINEKDMEKVFKNLDFDMTTVNIIVEHVPEHKNIGYESIILASGFKNK